MRPRMVTRRIWWTLPITVLLLALPAPPAHAEGTRDLYAADAFGSYSFAGQTVMSGKSAFVVLGCRAKPGTSIQSTAQSSEQSTPEGAPADGNAQTGSVNTSVAAIKKSGLSKSLSSAVANGINMLNGRITASRAKAVSATFKNGTGMHTTPAGSILSDLVVDGSTFAVSPGPNTTVTLPKVGYVILNEQASDLGGAVSFLAVNMIHVYATEPNAMGIPVGSQMIVSHAYSALKPAIGGILGGFAYGTKLFQGASAQSGPSAIVYMPCLGTDGKVATNQAAELAQPNVFDLATINDTAQGTVTSSRATGELASTVEHVNLLAGLVTADSVRADTHASGSGGIFSFNDGGSMLQNLVVAGRSVSSTVAPNTQIALPGIGTLWLHRVIRLPNSIDVRMIEIDIDQANPFGLQPGSVLQVAVAVLVAAA
jgi:hypothetical protein